MHDDSAATTPEPARGKRLPAGRKAEIAAFVSESGQVTVNTIADRFDVSSDTARRDLDQLANDGLIVRTRGGATSLAAPPPPDSGLDVRMRLQTAEKESIAALAAELVEDGDSIVINGGTTALALARQLHDHSDLTIATNNLRLPGELHPGCYRDVFLFGGAVRAVTQATTGPVHLLAADGTEVHVECRTAFIAVGAVSTSGYSTSNVGDSAMMRQMMAIAERVVVMADSTKFRMKMFALVDRLGVADVLITDAPPPREIAEELERQGVRVLVPGQDNPPID